MCEGDRDAVAKGGTRQGVREGGGRGGRAQEKPGRVRTGEGCNEDAGLTERDADGREALRVISSLTENLDAPLGQTSVLSALLTRRLQKQRLRGGAAAAGALP